MATEIQIGDEISRGWALFKDNMGLLIVVNLLGLVLASCTCGVLAGPMMVGDVLIIRRLLKKDPVTPQVGDVFKGFERFLDAFLWGLVLSIVTSVVTFTVVGLAVMAGIIQIGLMHIAIGGLSFSDTLNRVFNEIATKPFWMLVLVCFIASLLSCLGVFLCGIGIVLTMPIMTCIAVCAYDTAYGGEGARQPDALPLN